VLLELPVLEPLLLPCDLREPEDELELGWLWPEPAPEPSDWRPSDPEPEISELLLPETELF